MIEKGFIEPVRFIQETDGFESTLVDYYRAANTDVISRLDLVPHETGWNERIQNVIVILCASRSGSSLIFNALSSTGEVAAPGGEHEPWLSLTENKYPFIESDAVDTVGQSELLLNLIRNDLLIRTNQIDGKSLVAPLHNRFTIRRLADSPQFKSIVERVTDVDAIGEIGWGEVQEAVGRIATKAMPIEPVQLIDQLYGIPLENPPLIEQPLAQLLSDDDIPQTTLLFKSPSDVYRAGMYEKLFPNASIEYIHLTRGFIQTVNGLMDGWQKNDTDYISNPVGMTSPLEIQDYSIDEITRTYWCFDLFPGWEDYTGSTLLEICAQQWVQAHRHALEHFTLSGRLTFEQFYTDPNNFYHSLSDLTGIDTTNYDWSRSIMSTETPSQFRWKKRESVFRRIDSFLPATVLKEVYELQTELGYNMEEETWH